MRVGFVIAAVLALAWTKDVAAMSADEALQKIDALVYDVMGYGKNVDFEGTINPVAISRRLAAFKEDVDAVSKSCREVDPKWGNNACACVQLRTALITVDVRHMRMSLSYYENFGNKHDLTYIKNGFENLIFWFDVCQKHRGTTS